MAEFLVAVIGFACMISIPVGLYYIIAGIWGETGWYERKAEAKRDAAEDSVLDGIGRGIIDSLKDPAHYSRWQTSYGRDGPTIERVDGRVKIMGYTKNYRHAFSITVAGVGEFHGEDFKPCVYASLREACNAYQVYIAARSVLDPDSTEYSGE